MRGRPQIPTTPTTDLAIKTKHAADNTCSTSDWRTQTNASAASKRHILDLKTSHLGDALDRRHEGSTVAAADHTVLLSGDRPLSPEWEIVNQRSPRSIKEFRCGNTLSNGHRMNRVDISALESATAHRHSSHRDAQKGDSEANSASRTKQLVQKLAVRSTGSRAKPQLGVWERTVRISSAAGFSAKDSTRMCAKRMSSFA